MRVCVRICDPLATWDSIRASGILFGPARLRYRSIGPLSGTAPFGEIGGSPAHPPTRPRKVRILWIGVPPGPCDSL